MTRAENDSSKYLEPFAKQRRIKPLFDGKHFLKDNYFVIYVGVWPCVVSVGKSSYPIANLRRGQKISVD